MAGPPASHLSHTEFTFWFFTFLIQEVKVDVSVTSTIEMRQQAQGGEGTTEARHGLSRAPLPSSHGGF